MPITIVCPGCKKRFQVRDEFAGKSGPCPTCKTILKIPTKADEVKVHAPEEFEGGGRGTSGKLSLKPILREETKVKPLLAAAIGGGVLLVFALAWLGQPVWQSTLVCAVGLILVTPPIVLAAYTFLRDSELEPYRGVELYYRAGACSLVYLILWGLFTYIVRNVQPDVFWQWILIGLPIVTIGALAGRFSFDLEPASGFFHYAFYAFVIVLLAYVAGLGWVWQKSPETKQEPSPHPISAYSAPWYGKIASHYSPPRCQEREGKDKG